MTDQNLVAGDVPYPEYQATTHVPVKATIAFVKGELATIDANGYLVKITTTKIAGVVQVKNAVTGGAGDGDVIAAVLDLRSRILAPLPINAKKGDKVQINGSNGTGNLVVSVAAADPLNLVIGTIFQLYRNTALKSAAGELGVIDLGLF